MLSKASVQKPYTIIVAVVAVLVLGVISFMSMPTDLLPSMNLPYIVVATSYVGASPEEVETVVTKPLEASMASVGNLKTIRSTSKENLSTVILEFNDDTSMDTAMLELNAKIDLVSPNWGDKVGTPIMIKINPDLLPVVVASVDYAGMDKLVLSDYVSDTLLGQLEGIDGVASVTAAGLVEEEITVSIDQTHIDEVNSLILKEVDKELYKVEQKLLDGEAQLLAGKRKLDAEGKKALAQINEGLAQIRAARENLPETIAAIEAQRTELVQQKEQAEAGLAQLEAALAKLPTAMGEAERAALAALDAKIAAEQATIDALNARLAEIERQLQGASAEPASTPRVKRLEDVTDVAEYGEEHNKTKKLNKRTVKRLEEAASGWFVSVAYAEGADPEREVLLQEKDQLLLDLAAAQARLAAITDSDTYRQLAALRDAIAQRDALAAQAQQARAGIAQLTSGIATIDQNLSKLRQGILPGGMIEGMDQDTSFDEAEAQLIEARKKAKSALSSAASKIADAQKELGEARKEFEEKREEAFEDAKLDGVITVPLISQIIGAQNLSMPAGYLTENGQDYLVRVGDEYADVDELKDTLLFTTELETVPEVRLSDVAIVSITDNADEIYAKVNHSDGVVLTFQKQSSFSTATVAHAILDKFTALQTANPGLRLTTLLDQGVYIDMVIDSVLSNLCWGALLAVLVLLIFLLDYRPTVMIALSIPISVVVTFVTMYFTGITLNVMSLAGLAIAVGMLVDNSIVVIDNIMRLRDEGMEVRLACVEGARTVTAAVFSSTLTTISVFIPFLFVTGITRQLFSDLGLTITYALLASYVVSMTLVPALASLILRKPQKPRRAVIFEAISRGYARLLRANVRHGWPTIVLALGLLVFVAVQAIGMGIIFIPDVDSSQMTATLSIPAEYTQAERNAYTTEILDAMLTVPDIDTIGVFSTAGAMTMMSSSGGSGPSATYYITLKPDKENRNTVIAAKLQDKAQALGADLSIRISNMDISMLSGTGISVQVAGSDMDALRSAATDLAARIAQIEGVTDVSDGQEEVVPELTFSVDKQAAIENGLTVAQVYQYIYQTVMDGIEVSTITTGGKEYAVIAVEGKNADMTRETLADRTIEVAKANETIQVRLGDICTINETSSLSTITRENQRHIVTVSCDADADHNITLLGREVEAVVADYEAPSGCTIEIVGESETVTSAVRDIALVTLLSILLIYLVMVAQFQSFLMPFIVLFTIPLAFTGGLLALIATGMDLSVIALLGVLILAGVIVNNGIVFIDSVNQFRIGGMDKREAIYKTGQIRLRPILMTTLTTILGMSTLALGTGMGAELLQPMAVVTIGGLTYGTLLTLFIVPVLYDKMTGKKLHDRTLGKHAEAEPPAVETDWLEALMAEEAELIDPPAVNPMK